MVNLSTPIRKNTYEMATISRLLKIEGLFCKIALLKRPTFFTETYNFKEPTNCSYPIPEYTYTNSLANISYICSYTHVCIYMYVYIYINVHIYINVCVLCTYMYVYMSFQNYQRLHVEHLKTSEGLENSNWTHSCIGAYTHTHKYIYTHLHVFENIHVFVYMCTWIHMFMCGCVYRYITHMHMQICIFTHAHTHTHT